jgi:hypothetical protein
MVESGLTFKACLISKIDLAIGTVFSGLADQPAENPAWMLAFRSVIKRKIEDKMVKGRSEKLSLLLDSSRPTSDEAWKLEARI